MAFLTFCQKSYTKFVGEKEKRINKRDGGDFKTMVMPMEMIALKYHTRGIKMEGKEEEDKSTRMPLKTSGIKSTQTQF